MLICLLYSVLVCVCVCIYIYIYIYIYSHVIAHGDDRGKINTILPVELTVSSRQKKWPLRKNVGHRGVSTGVGT